MLESPKLMKTLSDEYAVIYAPCANKGYPNKVIASVRTSKRVGGGAADPVCQCYAVLVSRSI